MSEHFGPLSCFPPARSHPRIEELRKHNDDFFLAYWPFNSQRHRDHFVQSDLGSFFARCIPDGNFEKMIWVCRAGTLHFLIDDALDTDLVFDSEEKFSMIPGIKQIISGSKKPDTNSSVEIMIDKIWRAIEAGCTSGQFTQILSAAHFGGLLICTSTHNIPPYESLDQFVEVRRVNSGAYLVFGLSRYALEIELTDDQLNEPLVKQCECLAADLCTFANDLFSFTKEKLTDSAETNLITALQRFDGVSSEQLAIAEVRKAIAKREPQFLRACEAVLGDPVLGVDRDIKRWILALRYLPSGNAWWSQHCGRYNLPGHPAPRMIIHIEGVGDFIVPDPYPNTHLEQMTNGVPIARREATPIISHPLVAQGRA